MNIIPAFGQTYKNAEEVVEAWKANKDFKVRGGPYVSKNTWKNHGNKLDHLTYCWKGITVVVETGIGGFF